MVAVWKHFWEILNNPTATMEVKLLKEDSLILMEAELSANLEFTLQWGLEWC